VPKNIAKSFLPKVIVFPPSSQWTSDLLAFPIVVANAHKFATQGRAMWKNLPTDAFNVVIIDEAHLFPAGFWSSVVHHFSNSCVVFLTAIPYRTDAISVFPEAYQLSRMEAVRLNIIRDVDFQQIESKEDMSNEDNNIRKKRKSSFVPGKRH
jgi:superfamily II DNA or RNA helicase